MSEVMDEYELTQQGREQAQQEKPEDRGRIINDARQKQRTFMPRRLCIRMKRSGGYLILWMRRMSLWCGLSMGEKLANEENWFPVTSWN